MPYLVCALREIAWQCVSDFSSFISKEVHKDTQESFCKMYHCMYIITIWSPPLVSNSLGGAGGGGVVRYRDGTNEAIIEYLKVNYYDEMVILLCKLRNSFNR